MKKWLTKLRITTTFSLRDWLVFFAVMGVASAVCAALRGVSTSDVHVPLIFVLAVLIISLLTSGYFYGLLAALVSVITVNYAFTYPYNKLDFSVYGYPLTFLTMLAVGFVASTLTSRVKEQERVRLESEKERVRANLLRAISHDLRTPLTSISGVLETLINDDGAISDAERLTLLEDAAGSAEWLHRMVENLLTVTRIEDGGGSRLKKQPELLEEVIGEAVTAFNKRTPQVAISVSLPEEPLFVPMDAMLIEQVLINLFINAVEHGRGVTAITVTAACLDDTVSVAVEDNGGGFLESDLERLNQGKPARSGASDVGDTHRGMGIGLTVCRSILDAHGGSFHLANGSSGGARITLTLPLGGDHFDDQR